MSGALTAGPPPCGDGRGPGYPDGLPLYNAAGTCGQSAFVPGPSQVMVAKLSSWPVALGTPMRRATVAAVTAIASALGTG